MMTDAQKHKYRVEIARLDAEHVDLERCWTQVPWFAMFAVLAPIAGGVWGWGAAVVELLVSAALVGTRAYLISVRVTENRWTRARLLEDIAEEQGAGGTTSHITRSPALHASVTAPAS